jgi:DNA-binding NtrC family response regulator
MPPSVQTALLRVLQEREITRVGDASARKVDVRVIAATHRDLAVEVAAGRFRQDLLYRIRVARIMLPPLRERPEDLPLLAAWFLGQARAATGKAVHDVSAEAMEVLMEHPWPGNVRELKSAIDAGVIHAAGSLIVPADLPAELLGAPAPVTAAGAIQIDDRRLAEALARAGGNRTAAARLLGISRATLYRRLATSEPRPPTRT